MKINTYDRSDKQHKFIKDLKSKYNMIQQMTET